LFASPVLAQAAQGLETVTVTAERVTEDAQKTPIAMSVLSSQDLNKVGGPVDAALLQQTSPNIQVVDVGNGAAQFAVRGILSTLTTQVGDPAIAYNVDGVYLGRNDQAGATFFDEERVELLLGPALLPDNWTIQN
jgi:iron complex outermembrane receptor protein